MAEPHENWLLPRWSQPKPVPFPHGPGASLRTKYTPAILGFANVLLCVWADDQNTLLYSISSLTPFGAAETANPEAAAAAAAAHQADFFGGRVWTAPMPIICAERPSQRPEKTRCAPCLVVSRGRVHLVFADEDGCLVHFRYMSPEEFVGADQEGALLRCWQDRRIIDTGCEKVTQPPALCVYSGNLYCAYVNDEKGESGTVDVVQYDMASGNWTPEPYAVVQLDARGKMGLAEIADELHVFCRVKGEDVAEIRGSRFRPGVYDRGMELPPVPSAATGHGVSMARCGDVVTMCFDDGNGTLATREFGTDRSGNWSQVYHHQSADQPVQVGDAPSVTVVDNEFISFWRAAPPEGQDQTSSTVLWYMTRPVWPAPRLDRWMAAIRDDVTLPYITIPGAHDAASYTSLAFAGTQMGIITNLLEMGIRYLDIRARQPASTIGLDLEPIIAHGFYHVRNQTILKPLTLRQVFNECEAFLTLHPSEGIVLQLKHELSPLPSVVKRWTDEKFARAVDALIFTERRGQTHRTRDPWRLSSKIPTMAELRGHIQLIRRFPMNPMPEGMRAYGMDLSAAWPDNGDGTVTCDPPLDPGSDQPGTAASAQAPTPNMTIMFEIQDWWDPPYGLSTDPVPTEPAERPRELPQTPGEDIMREKWGVIERYLSDSAVDNNPNRIFINFTSANAVKASAWSILDLSPVWPAWTTVRLEGGLYMGPWQMAIGMEVNAGGYRYSMKGINYKLARFLRERGSGTFGIVVMDFVHVPRELIGLLVISNAESMGPRPIT